MLLASSSVFADMLTCPVRPGYVDCVNNKILITFTSPEWLATSSSNPGEHCTDKNDSYFKFDRAKYTNESNQTECSYDAINGYDEIIASLTLVSSSYTPDISAPYNKWTYLSSGSGCGFIIGTSIYNCPIKQK